MSTGRILFEQERIDLAKIVKIIYDRKLTNTAGGNFSFKVKDDTDKEYIIMTPTMMSEAYLGEISPSQILVVEPHTRKIIAGEGQLTREINMHESVYDTNPDIKAILHAHAPNAMFWATSGLPLPNLTEATQGLKAIPVLDFEPNCSEELADSVSGFIKKKNLELPHMLLLDSHGVLISTTGDDGMHAMHQALAILDTMEWNADIAYKQTIFQKLDLMDGYHSKGVKIGTVEDLKNSKEIWNELVEDCGH